jgi:methylmalonyl-CoA/ethylmalonyl-CoA epimerase
MIKRIHHIGIAVRNLKDSVAVYEKMLGNRAHIEDVPCQQVSEAIFRFGDEAEINLLEPMGPESSVAKFLEKRGEGLHHIALEVDDIDAELKAMQKKGFQLIDEEAREGVAGRIGFLHPKSAGGVLIELVQPRQEGEN